MQKLSMHGEMGIEAQAEGEWRNDLENYCSTNCPA